MKNNNARHFSTKTGLQAVLVALSLGVASQVAAISITPTNNGNTLASSILGSGITITSPIRYQGSNSSAGLFSGGSALGIDKGIILTTGSANLAVGPNSADDTTFDFGGAGNPNLDALIPQTTQDATTLAFDFTTNTGSLFFNYVFASEEYNEYVDSPFNDVFAFFVDGQNIAIAPNGKPVSVNNVNCGNPFGTTGPNCANFINNEIGSADLLDIAYDGFTKVFTAAIENLDLGTHSMEFSIADAGDNLLDSAVFIAGGTFSSTIDPEPTTPTVPVTPVEPNEPTNPTVPVDPTVPVNPDQPSVNVSEPATMTLLSLSLLSAGWMRKKKQVK